MSSTSEKWGSGIRNTGNQSPKVSGRETPKEGCNMQKARCLWSLSRRVATGNLVVFDRMMVAMRQK